MNLSPLSCMLLALSITLIFLFNHCNSNILQHACFMVFISPYIVCKHPVVVEHNKRILLPSSLTTPIQHKLKIIKWTTCFNPIGSSSLFSLDNLLLIFIISRFGYICSLGWFYTLHMIGHFLCQAPDDDPTGLKHVVHFIIFNLCCYWCGEWRW
jgi:hypothetical protein